MALAALDDEVLARVLRFLSARELEAAAVASRVVGFEVLPRFPGLWAALFRERWAALNFPLAGAELTLAVDRRLRERFPESCSESRMFQLLTHAITPLPAYADLDRTRRAAEFDADKHAVESLQEDGTRTSHVVKFGFNGAGLGDDRCVRANAPFPATHHIAVFRRRQHGLETAPHYEIGLVASGYFELKVSARDIPQRAVAPEANADADPDAEVTPQEELVSIGLVSDSFPLVGRQPGWNNNSFGYHSDNGHVYRQSTRGQYFGPRFGVDDTVGCGVRRDQRNGRSAVFFTHNGASINGHAINLECQHASWYPAIGMDSYQQVQVNFGQDAFARDSIVDDMFAECDTAFTVSSTIEDVLPWFSIADQYASGSIYSSWRKAKEYSLPPLEQCEADLDSESADEYDEYGELKEKKDEIEVCPSATVKSLFGLLTRRQQNRHDAEQAA